MVIAHRTPLIVVEDLHTTFVLVGSACQPHRVLVRGDGGANGTCIVGVCAGASVTPTRVGTVKDTLLCASALNIVYPDLAS